MTGFDFSGEKGWRDVHRALEQAAAREEAALAAAVTARSVMRVAAEDPDANPEDLNVLRKEHAAAEIAHEEAYALEIAAKRRCWAAGRRD